MRLLLSGGGHRAALGAIGCVAALVRREVWSDVDEVVSVSGGSIANAALAVTGAAPRPAVPDPSDEDPTLEALAALHARIRHDRARPAATPRRAVSVVAAGILVIAVSAGVATAAGIGPLDTPRAPALVGLVALVALAWIVFRRLAQAAFADAATALALPPGTPPVPTDSPRHHVVCATGLDTGRPYRFSYGTLPDGGGLLATDRTAAVVVRHAVPLADAVVASVSLPGLAHRRTPPGLGAEILVDGGISGVFGSPDPGADTPDLLAVDAARHLRPGGRLARTVRRVSLLARLARWLQVSLETSYLDDLAELPADRLVRLCTPVVASRDTPLDHALARARAVTAGLGLRDLDDVHIRCALIAAFVGTLEVLDATTNDPAGESIPYGGEVAWLATVLDDPGLEGLWSDLVTDRPGAPVP